MYEWVERFSRCWISMQWTFPRYQLTSVIPTSSSTWRNVETFFSIARPQRRAAKHLGHTWYINKRFCKSSRVFFSTLSAGTEFMEFQNRRASSLIDNGKEWDTHPKRGRMKIKHQFKITVASPDRQPKIQSSQVDSVDDLKSSSSTKGIQMPHFEVLDARIASALNKIIHNSHCKRRISLEEQKDQKEDRFLRGRQIAYLI